MANDKTYDRHVNIWINGKEVSNDISTIKKEMLKLINEQSRMTRGSQEYVAKGKEIIQLKQILKEHQDSLRATETGWNKIKALASGGMGLITAGIGSIVGAYNAVKGVIFSTDSLGDKFETTLSGWKSGLDAVARSIATMDFKNFGKNIKEAIEEGRRYAEKTDEISDKLRALKFREAEVSSELLKMRAIENSALSTRDEAIDAGKRAIDLEDQLATTRTSIAKERYENELQNAAVITGQSKIVVEQYLRQDEKLMKLLDTGKQYVKLQEKLKNLQAGEVGIDLAKSGLTANSEAASAITKQIEQLGYEAPELAKMYEDLGKLIDEKKDVVVNAYAAMKEAETSGLENTLRIRTKTDGLIEKDKKDSEDKLERERKESETMDEEVQNVIDNLQKEYQARVANADKTKKLTEDQLEAKRKESEAMDEEVQNVIDNLQKEYQARVETADQQEKEIWDKKMQTLASATQLSSALYDRQFAKLENQYKKDLAAAGDNAELKAKIDAEYAEKKNVIARKAANADKLAALFTIAINTAKGVSDALSKVATIPLVPWIILNGAIQAGIVAAKPLPEFAIGGYTRCGGKYEPVGIVHGNEWVANADMVANPVTGTIIKALEEFRVNNMPGFADGGMAPGGGRQTVGSGQTALISSDPELKYILIGVGRLLSKLDRDGVNMKFSYSEADNVRKGMNKLEEIENNVSL